MADLDDDTELEADGIDNPERKPKSSKPWLLLLTRAGKAGFNDYNDKCDGIDKQFASLERLSNMARDREFQIFWANIQVLGPSIYSRPPVPVVVPRFKDKRKLYRLAAELLERTTIVLFEMEDIDGVMRAVRDDLVVSARGVVWLRYETKDGNEYVRLEHVHRRDFLTDPARSWKEVDWAAKRSFMTQREMRKRFKKHSGDAYKKAAFAVQKDIAGNDDGTLKAGVWELWSKSANKVVWVTEGVDVVLDEDKPHLKLEGFFPCPKPAYGTTQRGSLIPVPDFVYYKDQIEEINELTGRIAALTEGLRLRGFYPAGAGEIGDAVEAAVKSQSSHQVLIPISNWAALGGQSAKDVIMWLPLDLVAQTITACIENRRQLIDDVYQITGLSDIMRGATQASETLGAQQLKSQYGSIRIRDRQDELTRIARDQTRIAAEIMAENFEGETMLAMSQMEIPTNADIRKQLQPLTQQMRQIEGDIAQSQSDPEVQQMAQQNPEQAQQVLQQAQQQLQQLQGQAQQLEATDTIEAVVKFLRDERIRPFVLDIETDSTIAPDENAAKQRATEFVTAIGGFMGQAFPLVQADPSAAGVVSDVLKYVASQYRAGREIETSIEEFAEGMKQRAQNPQPNPEAEAAQQEAQARQQAEQAKAQMEQQRTQADLALKQADLQGRQQEAQIKTEMARMEGEAKQTEAGLRLQEIQAQSQREAARADLDMQKGGLELEKLRLDIERIGAQSVAQTQMADAKLNAMQTKPTNGATDGR